MSYSTAAPEPQPDDGEAATACTGEVWCELSITVGWLCFGLGVACGAGGVLYLQWMREIERLIR